MAFDDSGRPVDGPPRPNYPVGPGAVPPRRLVRFEAIHRIDLRELVAVHPRRGEDPLDDRRLVDHVLVDVPVVALREFEFEAPVFVAQPTISTQHIAQRQVIAHGQTTVDDNVDVARR